MDDIASGRIRDDDVLIALDEVRGLFGGPSVSTCYVDAELMALKIPMTAGERKTKMIRFIKREVLELRAKRVERAETSAASVKAGVAARSERERERQKVLWAERKAKRQADKLARAASAKPKPRAKADA